jgi:hypothetical protein
VTTDGFALATTSAMLGRGTDESLATTGDFHDGSIGVTLACAVWAVSVTGGVKDGAAGGNEEVLNST